MVLKRDRTSDMRETCTEEHHYLRVCDPLTRTHWDGSLMDKQNGNNKVPPFLAPPFLRVDLTYYSLLSIFGISAAIIESIVLNHFECKTYV